AETPIEEFTPTPAFPALQYLESVDVEGVAWRAGLRTGDFLIEVNGVNVVKVGHKQVVALIRQGGNHLLMKVVSVSRKPEPEEGGRTKAPPPPKRAPSTTLTLRSKSMTAELEELGELRESSRRIPGELWDSSRRIPGDLQVSSRRSPRLLHPPRPAATPSFPAASPSRSTFPDSLKSSPLPPFPASHCQNSRLFPALVATWDSPRIPQQGEDEKLAASLLDGKFPRSTSMTDTVREGHGIPPPPQAYDTIRSSFKPGLEAKLHGLPQVLSAAEMYDQARSSIPYPERQKRARSMIILQDSSHLPVEPTEIPRPGPAATPPEKLKRKGRVIDNPYANMGQFNVSLFAPTKPQSKNSSSPTSIPPLTGKPLDPNSPLALALAARERALSTQVPSRSPTPIHSPDADRAAPLFVDIQTKEPDRGDLESLVSPAYSPGGKAVMAGGTRALPPTKSPWGTPATLRKEPEVRAEPPGKEEKKPEDKKSMIISIVDTSQQKPASSSDHHLETTSTISTVSSMSTLSSESGEPTDTYTSFADGQTFLLEKPPVPPKPKLKSQLSKGPVTFRDPLLKQSSDSELISQHHAATLAATSAARPRYLFQRRSKLWGDPMESRPGHGAEEDKPTVISELSSRLQQLNKDTRSLGEEPAGSALDPGKKSPVVAAR
ncbi:SH3 and multiple ankyrin repeat domains protein 3, partial [Corvus brachyrhynchos]